ncbi:proline-rich protein HaeIII subfamily 1-like [Muntiacus reevesi]|uniref:proline-rich protein HaeIII subfamily 1-like n=1 Tax=Muntiacus reevesi TaxID=9886 RepID=UPI0033074DA7
MGPSSAVWPQAGCRTQTHPAAGFRGRVPSDHLLSRSGTERGPKAPCEPQTQGPTGKPEGLEGRPEGQAPRVPMAPRLLSHLEEGELGGPELPPLRGTGGGFQATDTRSLEGGWPAPGNSVPAVLMPGPTGGQRSLLSSEIVTVSVCVPSVRKCDRVSVCMPCVRTEDPRQPWPGDRWPRHLTACHPSNLSGPHSSGPAPPGSPGAAARPPPSPPSPPPLPHSAWLCCFRKAVLGPGRSRPLSPEQPLHTHPHFPSHSRLGVSGGQGHPCPHSGDEVGQTAGAGACPKLTITSPARTVDDPWDCPTSPPSPPWGNAGQEEEGARKDPKAALGVELVPGPWFKPRLAAGSERAQRRPRGVWGPADRLRWEQRPRSHLDPAS